MGLGPLSINGAGSPFIIWGWVPFQSMGLGPLSINGAGSPFSIWGWVPYQSMGLGPSSLYGAGSPLTVWGWVPLQSNGGRIYCRYLVPWSTRPPSTAHSMCGSVPLLIQILGAGSPLNQWGWIPSYSMGLGPLAIDWWEDLLQILGSLEHPSAFYGAQHVWFCPTADPDLRGWVPFYSVGLGPLSSNGAGSPSYSMGLGPLSISGARSPFTLWGWPPFIQWGWDPVLFRGTEYHRWWCHGVVMLCRVHLCAGGGICHPACPAV